MSAGTKLRRLPWAGEDGRPVYLAETDSEGARQVAAMADSVECLRVRACSALLDLLPERLAAAGRDAVRTRHLAVRLLRALAEVMTVAVCRGERLAEADWSADSEEERRLVVSRGLLGDALRVLDDPDAPVEAVALLVERLAEAVRDTLAAAEVRGARLGPDGGGPRCGKGACG
ncbi:hypothetical protein RKE29_07505 [Streptomyces sp. B1866]|uniref:hypothetical protein n=1 Tax=Streptomyces sp. B1866 TaxID=3075431 RepID=UPI00288CC100|nr:hypothetical protein [Streptomyces sp. B1866]MDT3396487.1 hypothetical protein [Streptomyces sp. B1866]